MLERWKVLRCHHLEVVGDLRKFILACLHVAKLLPDKMIRNHMVRHDSKRLTNDSTGLKTA